MQLRQLRYLVEIADCGSQTDAARRLNMSQPALGLQIRALEDELGVALFVRRSRGMEPTSAGKDLIARARDILERVAQAQNALKAYASPSLHRLRLGAAPTPGALLIPGLLTSLAIEKQIHIDLREGLSADLITQLQQGNIDMALCYDPNPHKDLRIEPLLHDDLVLIGPPGRIGTNASAIEFGDLGRFPLILDTPNQITRAVIDRLAQRENVSLQIKLELESVSMKREFLISMDCFSIVPLGLFRGAIDAGQFDWAQITTPPISRTLCLLSRSGMLQSDYLAIRSALTPAIRHWIECGNVNWRALDPPC
ncbi:LysR family transcriptional regulator [Roseicitreum antarcticum]|uniref:LysR family transcriptional regulator, nitrogen assimilation regulatory protein n=1 Tax=Roseicitreum antarcticum TaxID=564137 RepID=A0A1H2W2U4_9RHOB|nr:LysR family transcriptional regulator [Roseicitreum antarcticum]SDW74837.1 LysR family transcriptional regulator, nitrogen assimilation regulatory protein [Roseicitreum antarcticum]